jgi:succinyl-diaminopimelate desuccinylase
MEKWLSEVSAYLNAHRQQMVSDLFDLVRIPSIAGEKDGALPFGKESDRAVRAAAKLFCDHGFAVKPCSEDGYALAVSEGVGEGIGVFAHCDVVPVNEEDWTKTKPFAPIEENGILYGRGVMDNKSGVVEALYALLALRSAGVPLKNRVTVYLGGCEEAGMGDIAAFVEKEQMPAVSIVPDGSFPVGIGEKGILRVTCRSRDSFSDVVELNGGKAFNVVLDHVQVALKNGESFPVEGLPAHASHPENGINAALKAAQQLVEQVCDEDKKILLAFAHAIEDCHGGNLHIASEGQFGKLTCANGITRIEDGHLVFTLDIRYGTEMDGAECANRLRASLEALGFTMEIKENKEGFLLDKSAPELQIILNVCRELFNKPEAKPLRMSGGTYARMLDNAYSIDNTPGPRVEGLPKGHGGAHQSDEALSIESLLKGAECLALMIARLDVYLKETV